jgi:beta-lactamase class A
MRFLLSASLFLAMLQPTVARQPSTLEAEIRAIIAGSGAEVAVAFRAVDGRDELLIDPDKVFHAQKLATGQAVSATSDAAMIDILKRQKFNEAIPAGVAAGTPVAHKTGNITRIHHDAGIVYAPRPSW